MHLPYTEHIDVAQNEYFTKYSFNRNFEKLVKNDLAMLNESNSKQYAVQTYNKSKIYKEGDIVFYKIHNDDLQFYILKSVFKGLNTHKPAVSKDIKTGKMQVVNSDFWCILGIDSSKQQLAAKDIADNYINEKSAQFTANHEQNIELSAHPTQKLGFDQSDILFNTFDNIVEDRSKVFYPYHIESFIADDAVYYGMMRKWDNGLLEYDLTFKLGYVSSDNNVEVLCANSLKVPHVENNYLYFKENGDYDMFCISGEYYTIVDNSKQLNLNDCMNTYSAKIQFIEPFKDTNYMMFTSNVKTVELEGNNINNEALPKNSYDPRLIVNGLEITGVKPGSSFKTTLDIPLSIMNICSYAFDNLQENDGYELKINITPECNLINIDENAFQFSMIRTITIPGTVRNIGSQAFYGCQALSSVAFYMKSDPKLQPKLGNDMFMNTSLSEISIFFTDSIIAEGDQLSDMLLDGDFQNRIGCWYEDDMQLSVYCFDSEGNAFPRNPYTRHSRNEDLMGAALQMFNSGMMLAARSMPQAENVYDIDLDEVISEAASPKRMLKSAMPRMMASKKPLPDLSSIIVINNHVIVSADPEGIDTDMQFDLNQLSVFNSDLETYIAAIAASAFIDFPHLTSIIIPDWLQSIGEDFINDNCRELVLSSNATTCPAYKIDLTGNSFDQLCISFPSAHIALPIEVNNISNLNIQALSITTRALDKDRDDVIHANRVENIAISANYIGWDTLANLQDPVNCSLTWLGTEAISNGISYTVPLTIDGSFLSVHQLLNYIRDDDGNVISVLSSYSTLKNLTIEDDIAVRLNSEALTPKQLLDSHSAEITELGYSSNRIKINLGEKIGDRHVGCIFQNAFENLDANIIEIGGQITSSDIERYAFKDANIKVIYFPDRNWGELSSGVISGTAGNGGWNRLSIPANVEIRHSRDGEQERSSHYTKANGAAGYEVTPACLCIRLDTDTGSQDLISVKWAQLTSVSDPFDLLIPSFVDKISANAINPYAANLSQTALNNALTSIWTIYVPNSITQIGASAFAGNECLNDLIFEPGIELEYIGNDIVLSCVELDNFTIAQDYNTN